VKRGTIPIWIFSVLLVLDNLLYLSGNQRTADFWVLTGGLLACYSLPFLALSLIDIPPKPSLERYVILTLFTLIFSISVLFPIRRFLPGYHPASLEGVAYLLIPIFECVLIGLFLLVSAIIRLFFRRPATSARVTDD
jgi:hypothetical protein